MKPTTSILLFFIYSSFSLYSQNITISGYMEDKTTGEKLIGANIYDLVSKKGTSTNVYGFYSITLPREEAQLQFSFMGYQTQLKKLFLQKDSIINVFLAASINLKEVQVVANDVEKIQEKIQMSSINISMGKVDDLPALAGEKDVMKTIQLMPGVQSGDEGSSSVYVRGGGPDQNLLLLDGVPLYNASHLFGFISVFNSDAINNTNLIKGSFPARYGGRLSSVIDIRLKEGNNKKRNATASVGIISSKITLEGPIKSEKTTYLLSGRRTLMDLSSRPLILTINALSNQDQKLDAGFYFYDLNAKISHKFSDKNRIFLSAYSGNDKFFFIGKHKFDNNVQKSRSSLQWGNAIGTFRWNHIFNNKLFSNATLHYSRYRFVVRFKEHTKINNGASENLLSFEYKSGIEDWGGKWEFDYFPSQNHKVKFGASETFHHFFPGINLVKIKSGTESTDTVFGQQHKYSHEFYAFAEDEISIGSKLKTNIGLHTSGFYTEGQFYHSVQPRLMTRYLVNKKISLKAGYAYMTQYLHLLSNPTIGLPTDLWVPVTKTIKPENAHQVTAGFASSIFDFLELSLEGYYKLMENLITYKDGASFFSGTDWQEKIVTGKGWSYGAELLLEKKVGNTTGWVGYTLSWTDRQFKEVNFGDKYPFRYDRRHDIGIALTHQINEKIDLGATWVYGTGKAVTLGTERFNLPLIKGDFPSGFPPITEIAHINGRNNYREPSYHRFDIGINLRKQKERGERILNFSIYNLYNRKNPFYLYFQKSEDDGSLKLFQLSIFPIIPSFSYNFKF